MLKALEERRRQREEFVDLGLAHTNQLKEVREYGS